MRTVLTLIALTACGASPVAEPPEPVAAPAPYVLTAAHNDVLGMADAHDGNVDGVISECAVCGLAMQGSADQSVTVGEYEVHLCSSTCKTEFEVNTAATIERVGGLLD